MANLFELIFKENVSVALVGPMCSGKSHYGQYLETNWGYKRYSFGNLVKHVFQLIYQTDVNKDKHRELLQQIGTIFRTPLISLTLEQQELLEFWKKEPKFLEFYIDNKEYIHKNDCWIDLLNNKYDLEEPKIVIDDCRYLNEVTFLKQKGFLIIRVIPNESVRLKRIAKLYPQTTIQNLIHNSELCDSISADFEIVDNLSQ